MQKRLGKVEKKRRGKKKRREEQRRGGKKREKDGKEWKQKDKSTEKKIRDKKKIER